MIVDREFIEIALWLSLIFSSPGIFRFSRVFSRFIINRFLPINTIVITHVCDGNVISQRRIKINGYIVDQLDSLKESARDE